MTKKENKLKQEKKTGLNKFCDDKNCPAHGSISLRGKSFAGTVISSKMHKSATIEWSRRHHVRKYERYEKRKSVVHVHNPPCISAQEGDKVKIMETRPISKTKHFVIVEKIGEDRKFNIKKEENVENQREVKERKKSKDVTTEIKNHENVQNKNVKVE